MRKVLKTSLANVSSGIPIPIVSGEQFVPMFLIFMNPESISASHKDTNGDATFLYSKGQFATRLTPADQGELKKFYLARMEEWKISKYSLYVSTTRTGNSSILLNPATPNLEYDVIDRVGDSRVGYNLTAPYYQGTISSLPHTTMSAGGTIRSVDNRLLQFNNGLVKSHFLLLVKAKHLQYLRACYIFQSTMLMDIPVTDIKFLKNSTISGGHTRIFESHFRPLITEKEIEVQFASNEVINSYLFQEPPRVTASELVRRAKAAVNAGPTRLLPVTF